MNKMTQEHEVLKQDGYSDQVWNKRLIHYAFTVIGLNYFF